MRPMWLNNHLATDNGQFGVEAANVFNHRNYERPNTQVDAAGVFGGITGLQRAEGAGPRSLDLTERITF